MHQPGKKNQETGTVEKKKNQVKLFVFFKTVSEFEYEFDQAAQRPFNGRLNVMLRVCLNNKNKTGLSVIFMPKQMESFYHDCTTS